LYGLIRPVDLGDGGQGRQSDDGAQADHRALIHHFTPSPKSKFWTLRACPREAEWPVNATSPVSIPLVLIVAGWATLLLFGYGLASGGDSAGAFVATALGRSLRRAPFY
jgi:hypothetical protein